MNNHKQKISPETGNEAGLGEFFCFSFVTVYFSAGKRYVKRTWNSRFLTDYEILSLTIQKSGFSFCLYYSETDAASSFSGK